MSVMSEAESIVEYYNEVSKKLTFLFNKYNNDMCFMGYNKYNET